MRHFWQAVAILVGTVVGAGILGIPYVVSQSGYLIGLIELVIIGLLMLATNLYLAEALQRTQGRHHLVKLAEIYLGKIGESLMMLSMIFGIYGALLAYLIGESAVITSLFGGNPATNGLIFFAIVAAIVFVGITLVEKADLFIISANILLIAVIAIAAIFKTDATNLATLSLKNIFIPYGVILFAYLGTSAIPEVKHALEKQPKLLRNAIILGSVIPIAIYLLFTTAVVGVVGADDFNSLSPNERIATIALGKYFPGLALLANLFALFSMTTAFISLGLALKDTYVDYNINKTFAWLLVVSVPLAIWLINTFIKELVDFIGVLGIVGIITGGLTGILVILINWRSKISGKRNPEFEIDKTKVLGYILIAAFSIGMIYEIFRIIS